MESHGGMILTVGKRRTLRKASSSATLSITNTTWTDPATNPGLRIEKPATNRLSYGTTFIVVFVPVISPLKETTSVLALFCLSYFPIYWHYREGDRLMVYGAV
jgi:hypothetical protein